jgi:hypothetical protein
MTDEEESERIRKTLGQTKGKDIKERFHACVMDASYRFKGKVMPEMIKQMMEDEEDREYLLGNVNHVLEDFFYNGSTLANSGFMKRVKEYSEEEYKKLYPRFIEFLFRNKIFDGNDNLLETITLDGAMTSRMGKLVEEISQMQGCDSSDIEWAGAGKYSIAYKVGSKVIKLARERLAEDIPDHPCVLKPMYDKKVMANEEKGQEEYLEVEDYLEPLEKTNFKENERIVLDLFTKLRKSGYCWIDARADNVGKTKDGVHLILDRDAIYKEQYFREHKDEIGKKITLGNYERFEQLRLDELGAQK